MNTILQVQIIHDSGKEEVHDAVEDALPCPEHDSVDADRSLLEIYPDG